MIDICQFSTELCTYSIWLHFYIIFLSNRKFLLTIIIYNYTVVDSFICTHNECACSRGTVIGVCRFVCILFFISTKLICAEVKKNVRIIYRQRENS